MEDEKKQKKLRFKVLRYKSLVLFVSTQEREKKVLEEVQKKADGNTSLADTSLTAKKKEQEEETTQQEFPYSLHGGVGKGGTGGWRVEEEGEEMAGTSQYPIASLPAAQLE